MMTACNRNRSNPYVDLIPQEILIEILLRVPLQSILSSKLVSKKWKNIINDPEFFKAYTNKSCTAFFIGFTRLCCLFIRHDVSSPIFPRITVRKIPLGLDKKAINKVYAYRSQLFNSGWSSGGIACVITPDGLFLCHNLFTGDSFTVSDSPMQYHSDTWLCYGFGYDPRANDYIILVVCDYQAHDPRDRRNGLVPNHIESFQNEDNGLFWVYSFGNKRWKRSNGFPYGSVAAYDWSIGHQAGRACSINGVLHWLVFDKENQKDVIVTYDLHTSRFGVMLGSVPYDPSCHPDNFLSPEIQSLGKMCHTRNLAQLNGQLCYLLKSNWMHNDLYIYTFKYEVWAMKEYGLGESWEKLASIDCSKIMDLPSLRVGNSIPGSWDCATPAMLYEDDGDGRKLLLFVCNYDEELFWYDVTEKKIEFVDKSTWDRNTSLLNLDLF